MNYQGCSCSGGTLDRFVRPIVMAVLARNPEGLHGYLIASHLVSLEVFGGCPPDTTGLYRVLKAMETEGYLKSNWDVEGSGPARRNYVLTEDGLQCLRQWASTLQNYGRNLALTLEFIEDSIGAGVRSKL
jgi:DNA-binding PadR family transcriptional regulator